MTTEHYIKARRDLFSILTFQVVVSNYLKNGAKEPHLDVVKLSITMADLLIQELNKEKKNE